jgi:DNA-binding FadR family transcriptional regulator
MLDDSMLLFKSVKSPTRMPDAIVRQIESKILLGQLKPLSMLPSETKLMSQFGVSRNTVREALRMLEASGMIKIKQGAQGGAIISRLTDEFISDFLIKAIRLGKVSGDSLSQFRLAFEPCMAEMLAKKEDIDQELLSQMEENILKVKEEYKMNKMTKYHNMDFHLLLALATGNPMFIVILKTLRVSLNFFITSHIRHKMQRETIKSHQKILKAFKKRDPVTAREEMYQHLLQIREVLKDGKFKEITRPKK